MFLEKKWIAISAQALVLSGTSDGVLSVNDAGLFKVKQTVILKATALDPLILEVKRVTGPQTLEVGRKGQPLEDRIDVSAYTLAAGSFLIANEQPRPNISDVDVIRGVFAEEPVVALRTTLVDRLGRYVGQDPDFPFHVQLSDGSVNIGTVHAQLEMFLSHRDNDPDAGDVHSSMRIGDGVDEMAVNPDGSINVNITPSNTSARIESFFNEISAVPAATPTTIVTYTAPVGKISFLQKVFVSGENIAKFSVKLNGGVIDVRRTYFGGPFNEDFDFSDASRGLFLTVGDVVLIEVEHTRPQPGDFNGRIQVVEV